MEKAYVTSALSFLRESEVSTLVVQGLENYRLAHFTFANRTSLSLDQIATVLPRMLREEFWCRLEGTNSFLHVGYDYYMYLGLPSECQVSQQLARGLGLFVEPFGSPYKHR